MLSRKTNRGFGIIEFTDSKNISCSIQKSSSAMEEAIWFGTDDDELVIFEDEDMGKYITTKLPKTFMVNNRMHLTQEQVKELLPILKRFADTGDID